MRKTGILIGLLATLLIVSFAFASWKGTGLRLGITTKGETTIIRDVSFQDGNMTADKVNATTIEGVSSIKADKVDFGAVAVTSSGPVTDINAGAANTVLADSGGNSVTIGGFANGTEGQVMHIAVVDSTNNVIIDNNNATTQAIFTSSGSDETVSSNYGGWTLACNGTAWFEVDQ